MKNFAQIRPFRREENVNDFNGSKKNEQEIY
jgi:hypothetical protein